MNFNHSGEETKNPFTWWKADRFNKAKSVIFPATGNTLHTRLEKSPFCKWCFNVSSGLIVGSKRAKPFRQTTQIGNWWKKWCVTVSNHKSPDWKTQRTPWTALRTRMGGEMGNPWLCSIEPQAMFNSTASSRWNNLKPTSTKMINYDAAPLWTWPTDWQHPKWRNGWRILKGGHGYNIMSDTEAKVRLESTVWEKEGGDFANLLHVRNWHGCRIPIWLTVQWLKPEPAWNLTCW